MTSDDVVSNIYSALSVGAVELRNALTALPLLVKTMGSDAVSDAVPATVAFDYPTVAALSAYLARCAGFNVDAADDVSGDASMLDLNAFAGSARRAVSLGHMVGALPSGTGPADATFDALAPIPGERWRLDSDGAPTGARFGGTLAAVTAFDANVFNITETESAYVDPQHRMLLELAHESFTGYSSRTYPVPTLDALESMGIAVGISGTEYVQLTGGAGEPSPYTALGGGSISVACGRLSYTFGWGGASFCTDTACSSALVAAHLAADKVMSGDLARVLLAGANVTLLPGTTGMFAVAGMLAPDGRCKTLDAAANGYVRSEACVTGIVEQLASPRAGASAAAASAAAVIAGSAVNQDGRSSSLTAPNGPAQQRAVRLALTAAGMEGRSVDVLHMHGTGTPLGDPIEVGAAAATLMAGGRTSPLVLASTKSRAGHAEPASGAVGLLAAVAAAAAMAVRPNLHLRDLNPHLVAVMSKRASSSAAAAFSAPRQSALVVPSVAAGVSSIATGTSAFAFQGTNAHVTLKVQTGDGLKAGAVQRAAVALWDRGRHWITNPGHAMLTGVSSVAALGGGGGGGGTDALVYLRARIGLTASQAYLWDHRVSGRALFPAAGFLELAAAGAQSALPLVAGAGPGAGGVPVLQGVVIPSPLILGHGSEVTISVDRAAGVVDVFTVSAAGNATHTSARLGGVVVQASPPLSFNAEGRPADTARGLTGEVIRQQQQSVAAPSASLGRLARDASVQSGENAGLRMPPAVLDANLQLSGARRATGAAAEPGVRVPAGIRGYCALSVAPAADLWASARTHDAGATSDGSSSFSSHAAAAMDGSAAGAVVTGLEMRLVRRGGAANALPRPAAAASTASTSAADITFAAAPDSRVLYQTTWMVTGAALGPTAPAMPAWTAAGALVGSVAAAPARSGAASLAAVQSNAAASAALFGASTRGSSNAMVAAGRTCVGSIAASAAEELGGLSGDVWNRSDANARESHASGSVTSGWEVVPRLERAHAQGGNAAAAAAAAAQTDSDAASRVTVITGGFGSVGVLAAAAQLGSGADRVVLLGRSGRASSMFIARMASGSTWGSVTAARCDVSSREEAPLAVALATGGLAGKCPRVDLLHAGGTLRDGTLARQTASSIAVVLAPKVSGIARLQVGCSNLQPVLKALDFSA